MPLLPIRELLAGSKETSPDIHGDLSSSLMSLVLAIMSWPKDEQKRLDFFKLQHLEVLEFLDATAQPSNESQSNPMLSIHRDALGGWKSISEAPPSSQIRSEFMASQMKGEWVGASLCLAYWLNRDQPHHVVENISLRKLWSFLYRTGDQLFEYPPEKYAIRDCWEDYKSVAHLFAAKFYVHRWMLDRIKASALIDAPSYRFDSDNPIVGTMVGIHLLAPEYIKHILFMAQVFQEFGLTFKPKHSHKPLLNPADLWVVTDLPEWDVDFPAFTFTSEALEILLDG